MYRKKKQSGSLQICFLDFTVKSSTCTAGETPGEFFVREFGVVTGSGLVLVLLGSAESNKEDDEEDKVDFLLTEVSLAFLGSVRLFLDIGPCELSVLRLPEVGVDTDGVEEATGTGVTAEASAC